MNENKIVRAQNILKELEIDSWIIVCNEDSDIHSHFLMGIKSHARHYIIVPQKGIIKVIATEMEAPMIQKAFLDQGIQVNLFIFNQVEEIPNLLAPFLHGDKIAINKGENLFSSSGSPYADYIRGGDLESLQRLAPKIVFISANQLIYKLRAIKTYEEVKRLDETIRITEEILDNIPEWAHIGVTEKELQNRIEMEYRKIGEPAFESIIAVNAHSADPHHNSSSKKIEKGVLLIDTGLKYQGMCSDITRTYWVGSMPSEEFYHAYYTIIQAKLASFKKMKTNTPMAEPDRVCREILASNGFDHEKLYPHGLGHALGFEVHDVGPRMNWKTPLEVVLQERMIYTNEPGLYWQNKWGIRIEDDVVIEKDGARVLTKIIPEPINI